MSRVATVVVVIALCLISFLAGAYIASNNLPFRNCFTPGRRV
jgi:hypothetical protein